MYIYIYEYIVTSLRQSIARHAGYGRPVAEFTHC